jgi:hypothetical protein
MKISELDPKNRDLALRNQKRFPSKLKDNDSINSFRWKPTAEGFDYWCDLCLSIFEHPKANVFVGPSAGKSLKQNRSGLLDSVNYWRDFANKISSKETIVKKWSWLDETFGVVKKSIVHNTIQFTLKPDVEESGQAFDTIVEETLDQIRTTLLTKGKEYRRNNDVFHNFNEGAKRTGRLPENVLQGFLLKHEISVDDMINDIRLGNMPRAAVIEEKMNDILIYNILLKAMLLNRVE